MFAHMATFLPIIYLVLIFLFYLFDRFTGTHNFVNTQWIYRNCHIFITISKWYIFIVYLFTVSVYEKISQFLAVTNFKF